ncbi:MAG: aliphatic sulfonate ABC transporter permease SsuC [Rhodospirillales bacterium]|nr:aliphatic sulfonate ABC transporter permease SsuC [Rhodospirillales bacterium]
MPGRTIRWQVALPWLLPILLLAIWQVSVKTELLSTKILPAPTDVFVAAIDLAVSGQLFKHIAVSFARAVIGFLIGGFLGFALGLLNGVSSVASKTLDSSLQMIRNVPHLALIPLVILWFGIDEEAKLFLVALGVFFPIYLNTYHGVRTVDAGLIEMGRVYNLRRFKLFRDVILPGALPSILVGFRYSLGIMWLTLIVAETISATSGIGYMTMNAREFLQTDVVLLGIIIYSLLGKVADLCTLWLERRCLSWHPAFQTSAAA